MNFYKSKVAGVRRGEEAVAMVEEKLNCKIMRIPFVYLGVEVGANPRRVATWEPILQKLQKRLTPWKRKILSFGGRLCLLNSVLSFIPLFYFYFFKLPIFVTNKISSLQRRFL